MYQVVTVFVFQLCVLTNTHMYTHQQPRRRPQVPYAPNVAPSRNLGKVVVVVAAVLGPETVEVLVTPNLVTRGTRASRSAKHGRSPRELLGDSQTRLNA